VNLQFQKHEIEIKPDIEEQKKELIKQELSQFLISDSQSSNASSFNIEER